jgi:hypothetical protein
LVPGGGFHSGIFAALLTSSDSRLNRVPIFCVVNLEKFGGVLMMSRRLLFIPLALLCLSLLTHAYAQAPSALYTWDNTGNAAPNIETWAKNFGANTVTLSNTTLGELTIVESGGAGADVAISDGSNRVRESSTAAGGGTDVTGLDFLEFDIGHNGSGPINVQFFVQASTGFTFVALGPDVAVQPGVNTYQVPLTGLTADQAVYLRTMGFNARSHAAVGDVTWTLREVRAGGTPLTTRDLVTHDAGTPEGGLQGAIVNFDNAAVQGNNGAQNQTGLSASGGALQWTDLGGSNGAAISWGNGTAWNGNTFNNRTTDASNYNYVTYRVSATEVTPGAGGTVGLQSFFQKNNFVFEAAEGGAVKSIPIDGQFHDVTFSLAGLTNMNVIDLTGLNLTQHAQDLNMRVDLVRFDVVPEPASVALLCIAIAGFSGITRRNRFGG